MRGKNKKTFELSAIKKYRQYDRMLWLIPIVWAILAFKQFVLDNLKFVTIGTASLFDIIIYYLCGVAVISAFPFFIGKVILKTKIKTTMKNCTITSVQDFDYYRDKLAGLSPATISILTDLEIEQKKDVAASVLQYENLGLLAEEADHTYHTTEKYDRCNDLNESDRYLIEHLVKGDFDWENDTKWRQLAMDEAVSEGYITKIEWPWKVQQKEEELPPTPVDKIKRRLVKLVLGVGWIYWFWNASPRIMALQSIFGTTDTNNVELADWISTLYSQPKLLLAIAEEMALFIAAIFILSYKPKKRSKKKNSFHKSNFVALGILFVWIIWTVMILPTFFAFDIEIIERPEELFSQPEQMRMFIIVIPFIVYTAFILTLLFTAPHMLGIISKNTKSIKRTDYGNLMAECVYGMKNFIHDFSNLNDADKRQVVLWEDYLVYAVVLEENEGIVNEISRTRRDVL